MEFEWDADKRVSNIEKHSLDFRDTWKVFVAEHVVVPSKQDHEEERLLATAKLNNKHLTVVYTMREEVYRIISFRIADNEIIRYNPKARQPVPQGARPPSLIPFVERSTDMGNDLGTPSNPNRLDFLEMA